MHYFKVLYQFWESPKISILEMWTFETETAKIRSVALDILHATEPENDWHLLKIENAEAIPL